jgi:hypothetical protein
VEHPIWQTTHLRMTALAGVIPDGVGQGDYLLDGLEYSLVQVAAAAVATGQAGPSEPQFPGAARRADDAARMSHAMEPSLSPPSPLVGLLLIEPTIVPQRNGSVTVSVTEGEIRQRDSPRARTRGVRISYGSVVAPSYSGRLRSLDPAEPECAAPNQVTSARCSPDWASQSGSSDTVTQAT